MTELSMENRASRLRARLLEWSGAWLAPKVGRRRIFRTAFIACVLAVVYWGVIASNRYVSEARIILQRTDLASSQTMDFGSLLTGVNAGPRTDQLLLRDYLLSVDMLARLDRELDLRGHFSDLRRDPLSRLRSRDVTVESFHRYFRSRVSVEYDEYAGVLSIKAQAYSPEMAQRIAAHMVAGGEAYMNAIAHQLAQEQVDFLERQVSQLGERATTARQQLVALQNAKGMVSPQATAEGLVTLVNQLEARLAELRAKRTAMAGYLAAGAPGLVELNLEISALEQQIAQEKARLAAPKGRTLNRDVAEFQRLEMAAQFSMDVYKTALVALEKGRVEATRTLKKVSVLQHPTRPEYPLQPRRLYNSIVFILFTMALTGILLLLTAIIRDHRD